MPIRRSRSIQSSRSAARMRPSLSERSSLPAGTLTDTSGITLSSGSLTGFGTVSTGTTTGADFDGAGTVLATGGVLSFAGRASSDSATKYQIADAAGSGLKFSNQVGSLATVT